MATMLAFLVTDADVSPPFLRALWRQVAEQTFNRVRVDGETSTSDAALVLANGAAGGPCLRGPRSPGARALRHALHAVAEALAREIARDGEGATKLVRVLVSGARSADEALRAGRRIADSPLVKTAIYGGDPNWGRILQTVGAAEVRLNLRRAELRLCGVPVFRHGAACGAAARAQAARRLRAAKEVEIAAALGAGRGRAQLWTCDLSPGYIRINAASTERSAGRAGGEAARQPRVFTLGAAPGGRERRCAGGGGGRRACGGCQTAKEKPCPMPREIPPQPPPCPPPRPRRPRPAARAACES